MTICRTCCIQILRTFLYFQNWNWEKNFEVCTLQRTTSRQMVSTFIFRINTCMQKDWKKGTEVKLCTINVLSLLSLRSIWTGRTSSAAASASWICDSISVPVMSLPFLLPLSFLNLNSETQLVSQAVDWWLASKIGRQRHIHSRKYLGQPFCLQTSAFGVGI